MIRHRTIIVVVVVALGLDALETSVSAGGERYQVIVHPGNPVTSIDERFLRNAYLRKEIEWSDGQAILPVDLVTRYSVRDQFTHHVLKKTAAQLKSYWNQRLFSGKGVPPPEADVSADVIAYVLANPGAVGYLPADLDPGGAKVVEVR
jgi:ABC-type phosphate transport system substrate-binding protein